MINNIMTFKFNSKCEKFNIKNNSVTSSGKRWTTALLCNAKFSIKILKIPFEAAIFNTYGCLKLHQNKA